MICKFLIASCLSLLPSSAVPVIPVKIYTSLIASLIFPLADCSFTSARYSWKAESSLLFARCSARESSTFHLPSASLTSLPKAIWPSPICLSASEPLAPSSSILFWNSLVLLNTSSLIAASQADCCSELPITFLYCIRTFVVKFCISLPYKNL